MKTSKLYRLDKKSSKKTAQYWGRFVKIALKSESEKGRDLTSAQNSSFCTGINNFTKVSHDQGEILKTLATQIFKKKSALKREV